MAIGKGPTPDELRARAAALREELEELEAKAAETRRPKEKLEEPQAVSGELSCEEICLA